MGQGRWEGAPEGYKQHGLRLGLPVEISWLAVGWLFLSFLAKKYIHKQAISPYRASIFSVQGPFFN